MTLTQTVALGYFEITLASLCGVDRFPKVVLARHVCQYLERERGASYPEIGLRYRRDHTTILAAHRHVSARLAADDERYVKPVTEMKRRIVLHEAEEVLKFEPNARMACERCGVSVTELVQQIRDIHRRLDSLGAKE